MGFRVLRTGSEIWVGNHAGIKELTAAIATKSAPRRDAERAHVQGALDRLTALVAGDLEAVNTTITGYMQSDVPMIPQLAGYLIEAGGKRIRPMLTLAAARLCGYAGTGHVKLATAVEFIHTASLLHDDVVDNSSLRRGKAAANIIFGNQASVLVGDYLFSRSFRLMVETGSLSTLDILANAAAIITEGEVLQLTAAKNIATSEDTYMKVIAAKTAALFAAAAEVGGVIAGRPARDSQALYTYGRELGIAFQLVDDALDYGSLHAKFGKSVGDDFREGKVTLPVILAFQAGDMAERAFWTRVIADGKQHDSDLDEAIRILARHNAVGQTLDRAHAHADAAKAALQIFPASPLRDALSDVADFCVDRAY